ncbi:hypothetical protein RvY_07430-2 [Ramazzottius varieornatus]|uniref:Prenylcysteine lyase domain-containing protein n=1 Tax=Ramazzottius varieornatus TaxID=947166 RepID=A0A1D1V245_RAMVA|nr:hypothetical protein RvY_07430-2 [Ramazzottius varieornatus]
MAVYWRIFLSASLVNICCTASRKPQDAKRIGIIGGGIGGCASSLFLRDALRNDAYIVVYEAENISGRVRSVKLKGNEYEAGGSIFHEKNELCQRLVKRFGLKTLKDEDDNNNQGTLINYGSKVLFRSSDWSVFNAMKAFYRYGFSPLKLKPWVDDYITKFARIYDLFGRNCSYSRPSDLMFAADAELVDMFFLSLTDAMRKAGFGELFITEVAGAAMRVNYNQETSVPAFVGSISLAGMEGPLHRVKGGNEQLPHLACRSADTISPTRVVSVKLLNDTRFQLVDDAGQTDTFDFVVLASPLVRDRTNVEFIGFPVHFTAGDWVGSYQTTVATFVEGW